MWVGIFLGEEGTGKSVAERLVLFHSGDGDWWNGDGDGHGEMGTFFFLSLAIITVEGREGRERETSSFLFS